jgi:enamine deaminase RidA (YjgF/YER057c/UK114 family)
MWRNIFRTIAEALAQAGASLNDVVRAQYFVTDRAYCEPVLAVCGEVFGQIRPAAGIYIVAGLLKPEMKVEIEVTARFSARHVQLTDAQRREDVRNNQGPAGGP